MNRYKKLIPILILVICLFAFFAFDLQNYLSFEYLKIKRFEILTFVDKNFVLAILIYASIYIVSVAVSAPVGLYLSLVGGFLFGVVIGTITVVISATIGASILFLSARYAFSDIFRQKSGKFLQKIKQGFNNNAFFYILFLRLAPVFPFFIVNIVPAFLNVSFVIYFFATLFGIIPGTTVLVLLGKSIGSIIEENGQIDSILSDRPEVLISLIGLSILSLSPIIFKKFFSKEKKISNNS